MLSRLPKAIFIIATVFLALPLIFIIFSWFFASSNIAYLMDNGLLFLYIKNSLVIAVFSSALALIIGVFSAYLVSSTNIAFKRTLRWLLVLPIAVPSYIAAIIYSDFLGGSGPVQVFIRNITGLEYGQYWFFDISSIGGAVFILAITLYPYIYLLSFNAFKMQSRQSIETGKLLGLNNVQIFFKLMIPMARPSIFVGLFLVLMESLADFGVVSLFGIPSFTTGIYRAWNDMYDSIAAAQIAAILLIFVIAILALEKLSRSKMRYYNFDQYRSDSGIVKLPRYLNVLSLVFCLSVVVFGFILPISIMVYWSFDQIDIMFDQHTINALYNSLIIGVSVAVTTSVLGLIMAFIMRYNGKSLIFSALTNIATAGYAIPGSVVAVSILLLLIKLQNEVFGGNVFLIGTVFAVIWACSFRFLTISYNNIASSLCKITPVMDDVSKTLGASNFAILTKIHIPTIYKTLLVGFLLVFVDTIKELPATILLRPFNFDTLAIRTYELANDELIQYSGPTGLLLILISILPIWFINRIMYNTKSHL